MEYTKQHLSIEQQADLLVSRGLCADRELLLEVLENVGYQRLSAYWHPMRKRTPDGEVLDEFVEGASFDPATGIPTPFGKSIHCNKKGH